MMIVTHEMGFARHVSNRVFYMDQGEVYEDGTPEEVMDHPKRNRTRIFLEKLKTVVLCIESPNCDLPAMNSALREFCFKNRLKRPVEEAFLVCLREVFDDGRMIPRVFEPHKLHVIGEYNDKTESIVLRFMREADRINICENASEHLLKTFDEITTSVDYEYRDGMNILSCHLKGE